MTARPPHFLSVVTPRPLYVVTPRPTDEILAAIAAEEPHGATADQVARTISLDHEMVQAELEEMVAHGDLDRRGIGGGAVYTLNACR